MEKNEIVTGILKNLSIASERCHLCPADSLEEMGNAAMEIDRVVSGLSGTAHVSAPDGEGGVPAARFFLKRARERMESFQRYDPPVRVVDLLENVLVSSSEFLRGLPV